ncbi:MAG TPA: hypothetical protein VGM06_24465 [Polyangiaceae bacterium]|jgi:hypothetical protein
MSRGHAGTSNARAAILLAVSLAACKPGLDLGHNNAKVTLSQAVVIVPQDGANAVLDLTLLGDAAGSQVDFPVAPMPAGVSLAEKRTNDTTESLTFVAAPAAKAGDYPTTVTAINRVTGAKSDPVPFVITVAVTVTVSGAADPTLGIDGGLAEVATTSFQAATFQTHIPNPSALEAMHPPHPLVQIYDPTWLADGGWDSSTLDDFVRTLDMVSMEGPELQIFNPPLIPEALDPTGTYFDFSKPANVTLFADYCANLVRYYNAGGFTYQGQTVVNPNGSAFKVKWWGILGDTNPDPAAVSAYPNIYNQAVAEMLDADSTIQVAALEFTDNEMYPPSSYLPAFVLPADAGGVNQPVGAIALHLYSTHVEGTLDSAVFQTVPQFAQDIAQVRTMVMDRRSNLVSAPIWVTQSNVNSEVPKTSDAQDVRGTSAFFAAWAPYMFSQLGRSGVASFSHWDYTAGHDPGDASLDFDPQNAEVNYDNGAPFLSYWVDLWLAQTYLPGVDPAILQTTTTDQASSPSTDVLVTERDGHKVVVMFEDIAVADPLHDLDGPGAPRTVVVDLKNAFADLPADTQYSATLVIIDVNTDPAAGPTTTMATVQSDFRVPITLGGYGVAFLTVTPAL